MRYNDVARMYIFTMHGLLYVTITEKSVTVTGYYFVDSVSC